MTVDMRPIEPRDADACVRIIEGLPTFFTDDVPDKVRQDIGRHGGWTLLDDGEVIGFCVIERRTASTAEILWMAVAAPRRGLGRGTEFLREVLSELILDGVDLVEVKTLDRSSGYEPYVATQRFWEKVGFVRIDVIDPLPGWKPGHPAAIHVAALAPTV